MVGTLYYTANVKNFSASYYICTHYSTTKMNCIMHKVIKSVSFIPLMII